MGVWWRRGWLRLLLHYAENPMRTRGAGSICCSSRLVLGDFQLGGFPHRIVSCGPTVPAVLALDFPIASSRFPHCSADVVPAILVLTVFSLFYAFQAALSDWCLSHIAFCFGGREEGIFASLSYFSLRLRAPIGVSPTHRIFFWGEGGGHLCLRQLLLAKVFSTRSHCFITGMAIEFITYVWSCGIWIN
uniref:Uncharacterized protein n=1 Tax=Oryza glumipatula TaxID=40148 RepID=A0A0D9YH87_9ORYZ